MIPKMRTIREAAEELRREDANTAITPFMIRRLVLEGIIPHVKAGNKRLISMDALTSYLSAAPAPESSTDKGYGTIRPVRERGSTV